MALREARQPGEVCLLVNELTPESRAALLDRTVAMVITTPVSALCRDLFRFATEAIRSSPSAIAGPHLLKPELILPEPVSCSLPTDAISSGARGSAPHGRRERAERPLTIGAPCATTTRQEPQDKDLP